jgi:hypothetical protein
VAEAGQVAAEQLWEHEELVEKVEAEARGAEAEEESVTVAVEASVSVAEAAAIVGVASAAAVEVVAEVQTTKCCRGLTSLRWTWRHQQTGKERQRIRQLRKRKRSG